jgi:hypothetical protein
MGQFQRLAITDVECIKSENSEAYPMAEYRYFQLNGLGRVSAPAKVIQCRDDDEALSRGEALVERWPVEVWDGQRRVGTILTYDE